jgi:5-methylcytosine-specific restriction endonuclease McrA
MFSPRRYVDRCCSKAHGRLVQGVEQAHKRRALKLATEIRPVRIDEIAERDKYRCHICGKKVGKRPGRHSLSRSLDHLVPLSKGGEHTPENVRLAHLGCNVLKGNRGGNEQLLLIG